MISNRKWSFSDIQDWAYFCFSKIPNLCLWFYLHLLKLLHHMDLMFSCSNKLKWNVPLPAFVFTSSLLHPPSQLKENAGWLGTVHTSYICCHTFISLLLTCSQASAFSACTIVFCVAFFSGLHHIADLIFDSWSYCNSKPCKSLRSCGKLASPFVVKDAAGTPVCCRIVTPLSLHFCSLREGNGIFRGYTASCVAPKAWDWVMFG